MEREKANGLVGLGGGVQVSCREKFGGIRWVAVQGILRGRGVGFCWVFRVMKGEFRGGLVVG